MHDALSPRPVRPSKPGSVLPELRWQGFRAACLGLVWPCRLKLWPRLRAPVLRAWQTVLQALLRCRAGQLQGCRCLPDRPVPDSSLGVVPAAWLLSRHWPGVSVCTGRLSGCRVVRLPWAVGHPPMTVQA